MRRACLSILLVAVAVTVAHAGKRKKRRGHQAQPAAEPASATAPRDARDEPLDDEPVVRPLDEPVGARDEAREAAPRPRKRAGRPATELYFRAGIAHVEPRIASGGTTLEASGIAKLATPTEPVQGGTQTDPTNVFTASVGIAPAVFRGYLAFETLLGIPRKTQLRAKGDLANKSLAPTALGLVPTGIPPLGEELGEASAVPLMLTALVRSPMLGPLRVYAGGGPARLYVTDARITNRVLTEVATPELEVSPAWGVVAQAGLDARLWRNIHARLDVKEMWFQTSESRITNIHVRTQIPYLETVDVGSARSKVRANPIIVQIGVGASF